MILLGIGSNLGHRAQHLHRALAAFPTKGIRLLRRSLWYESPPWGIVDQPGFLNGVCEVAYDGSPEQLLAQLLTIEEEMGRVREQKWGPRLIDLDILEFHRLQLQTERLCLPHPFYPERAFVLVPLAELEPDWVPTGYEIPIGELIAGLDDQGIVPFSQSTDSSPDS